jgi:pimeloyl-ACP methyl ester carboxylesterase
VFRTLAFAAYLLCLAASLSNAHGAEQPQTAVVYLHGYCGAPDSWLPLVRDLEVRLPIDVRSPLTRNYSAPLSFYYVRFDGQTVAYTSTDPSVLNFAPIQALDTRIRVFLVDFYAPNVSTNAPEYPKAVANISILNKGHELAEILLDINQRFAVKDFILIGHSMGGLVARTHLQGLSLGTNKIGSPNDIRKLISIDTPHRGAVATTLLDQLGVPLSSCFGTDTVNR